MAFVVYFMPECGSLTRETSIHIDYLAIFIKALLDSGAVIMEIR